MSQHSGIQQKITKMGSPRRLSPFRPEKKCGGSALVALVVEYKMNMRLSLETEHVEPKQTALFVPEKRCASMHAVV
jgi:hypothetical protein